MIMLTLTLTLTHTHTYSILDAPVIIIMYLIFIPHLMQIGRDFPGGLSCAVVDEYVFLGVSVRGRDQRMDLPKPPPPTTPNPTSNCHHHMPI